LDEPVYVLVSQNLPLLFKFLLKDEKKATMMMDEKNECEMGALEQARKFFSFLFLMELARDQDIFETLFSVYANFT
jgi:hypothetical protein